MSEKSNILQFRKRDDTPKSPSDSRDFQSFVACINSGDELGAARNLQMIFAIPEDRSRECVAWFIEGTRKNPNFISEAQQLRVHLIANESTSVLLSLHNSFGLQGPEALMILARMQGLLAHR